MSERPQKRRGPIGWMLAMIRDNPRLLMLAALILLLLLAIPFFHILGLV
jgi:hypothetical protein